MAPFKDEHIIVFAPGSQTTLAQLGLPESFTPARFRFRTRMFPSDKDGEWEPYKVRRKEKARDDGHAPAASNGAAEDDELEEDFVSEEGAVWPMTDGRITNWDCFFALLQHIYNQLNPPFHTPILLIGQPCWTVRDHERLTQFFFEKFKMPAFALMDAATAISYAYGVQNATVVDVGFGKADVTAISDFIPHETGRSISIPKCGGEAMTQRLLELLSHKKFTRDMCEQLKMSPITEILPPGTPLPGSAAADVDDVANPTGAAMTGAHGSGPAQRTTAGALGEASAPDTEISDDAVVDSNEGILDVTSLVASGKMNEYLAKKEREKAEKAEKAAAKKKGGAETAPALAKQAKLPNSKREKTTFFYADHDLLDELKRKKSLGGQETADAKAALDEGRARPADNADGGELVSPTTATRATGAARREIEVGRERFRAASGGILDRLADAIYRTVSAVEAVAKRSDLWDSLIIVGNGARVRGFKEALIATLNSKYIVTPSSATIFTSELPSNTSTPTGTGANTPQPQLHPPHGHGVNPLLIAATTANQHLAPSNAGALSQAPASLHSSHGQTPTSIKLAKVPEYFPEWKEVGYDEAAFLGAQIAAKVLFINDQGLSKGFMTRNDYNETGPAGIGDFQL